MGDLNAVLGSIDFGLNWVAPGQPSLRPINIPVTLCELYWADDRSNEK